MKKFFCLYIFLFYFISDLFWFLFCFICFDLLSSSVWLADFYHIWSLPLMNDSFWSCVWSFVFGFSCVESLLFLWLLMVDDIWQPPFFCFVCPPFVVHFWFSGNRIKFFIDGFFQPMGWGCFTETYLYWHAWWYVFLFFGL